MGDEMKRHFDKLERQLIIWETIHNPKRPLTMGKTREIYQATLTPTKLLQVRIKRYSFTVGGNGVRITNKTIRQHEFRTRSGKESQ